MHQKAPRGHVHTEPRQRMKRELLGARLLRLSGAKHTDGAMAVRMLAEQEVIPEAPNVEGFLAERGTAESLQQSIGVPSIGGALDTITCDDVQIVFCVAHCPSKAIMGS